MLILPLKLAVRRESPGPNSQLNCPSNSLNWTASLESYVMTDGQSASLSWNKAPIRVLWPDFYYHQTVAGLLMVGLSLSLMRGQICCLQLLLLLASTVILRSKSRGTHYHILLSQIQDFPFHHLLWLAGLRWRYLTPLPHGTSLYSPGMDHTENTSSVVRIVA
jgi:hypothetical protein